MAQRPLPPVELVLYTGEGCSLCLRLEELIAPHLDAIGRTRAISVTHRDIADDPGCFAAYCWRIPVVTCGEKVILEGRPEAEEVAAAMAELRDGN